MIIDCEGCAVRYLACAECVVTVLLALPTADAPPGPPLDVDEDERRALAVLADSGLVPRLRLVPIGPPGSVGRSA